MVNYVYDGSFEGLLTAIFEAYYRREEPEEIYSGDKVQENLFYTNVVITTGSEKADRVYRSIETKISVEALEKAYNVFLSGMDGAGTLIYRYLQLGWRLGKKVDLHLADERVLTVHNISRKVMGECHRMLGLIRFKKIDDNLYYAVMEPDYNITELVAPHFVERLADQNWIIHDLKRNLAAVYNRNEWFITEVDSSELTEAEEVEEDYSNLWKNYFKNIAIASRINPKLQKRCMPVRYWKHLTEKQAE